MNSLGIIAGNRDFPLHVARSARQMGVQKLVAVGFPGITSKELGPLVDEMVWVGLGQVGKLIESFSSNAIEKVVMVGQIPHRLALRALKFDLEGLKFYKKVREKNARTVLGALISYLEERGLEFLDSTKFLKDRLAGPGVLSRKKPTSGQLQDLEYGWKIARILADVEAGQTVVVKKGVLVALEGMEGTDATIERAGHLAGSQTVIVKVARTHQDMRYDVPIVGIQTLEVLKKVKASVLGIEAGKTLILEGEEFFKKANDWGLVIIGMEERMKI